LRIGAAGCKRKRSNSSNESRNFQPFVKTIWPKALGKPIQHISVDIRAHSQVKKDARKNVVFKHARFDLLTFSMISKQLIADFHTKI
jgi:hypothetical protein